MKFSFAALAKYSTSRAPWLKGLLPAVGTMAVLFGVSIGIAAFWLFCNATLVTVASLLAPTFITLGSISGLAFLNLWFSREIGYAEKSVRDGSALLEYHGINLKNLVDDQRMELYLHLSNTEPKFKKRYPTFEDMPKVRLGTYFDHHFAIKTYEGRNPGRSAIYFASGALSPHDTQLTVEELKADILIELHKIYAFRGVSNTITRAALEFLTAVDNITAPKNILALAEFAKEVVIHFLKLIPLAVQRSYVYNALTAAFDMGHGFNMMRAIDKRVNPNQTTFPTDKQLLEERLANARPQYEPTGFLAHWLVKPILTDWLIKPIVDFIDANEKATDDKTGYRIFSFFDECVREFLQYCKELKSGAPRATNEKEHLRDLFESYVGPRSAYSFRTAPNDAALDILRNLCKEKNQPLRNEIQKYDEAHPTARVGYNPSWLDDHHETTPVLPEPAAVSAPPAVSTSSVVTNIAQRRAREEAHRNAIAAREAERQARENAQREAREARAKKRHPHPQLH